MKLLDVIHLQKYIYLIQQFLKKEIAVELFEKLFLQLRRDDHYWMNGHFDNHVGQVLNTFFLDIDEYTPSHLFDKDDLYSIDEDELRKRSVDFLKKLTELTI